jgi:heat shock protein HslJ
VGESVVFDGSTSLAGSTAIRSYNWAFGNGRTGRGATASTTYDLPGTYQVFLTVADENGLSDGVSHEIVVSAGLEDTKWVLDSSRPGARATVVFTGGAVSGSGGCNSYSGAYVATDSQLTISDLTMSQRLCPEPVMQQETDFFSALATAQAYAVSGSSLTIDTAAGALTFSAAR